MTGFRGSQLPSPEEPSALDEQGNLAQALCRVSRVGRAEGLTLRAPPFPTAACNLPIVTGPCRGYNQLWAFDAVQGKCVLFTYGGCQGNGNKFYSEKECREYCGVPGNGRRTRGCYWVQAGEPW